MIDYKEINLTNLDICDFADANDFLDARVENQYRMSQGTAQTPPPQLRKPR